VNIALPDDFLRARSKLSAYHKIFVDFAVIVGKRAMLSKLGDEMIQKNNRDIGSIQQLIIDELQSLNSQMDDVNVRLRKFTATREP